LRAYSRKKRAALEEGWLMDTAPGPVPDGPSTGGRIALLALAGALLIIFLTLFVAGLALGNRDAADASATFTPAYVSATPLRTIAPQTPGPDGTQTSRETPSGGKPTRTPTPTVTPPPSAADTPTPATPSEIPTATPTISSAAVELANADAPFSA
jgi:hypothetical protein